MLRVKILGLDRITVKLSCCIAVNSIFKAVAPICLNIPNPDVAVPVIAPPITVPAADPKVTPDAVDAAPPAVPDTTLD